MEVLELEMVFSAGIYHSKKELRHGRAQGNEIENREFLSSLAAGKCPEESFYVGYDGEKQPRMQKRLKLFGQMNEG